MPFHFEYYVRRCRQILRKLENLALKPKYSLNNFKLVSDKRIKAWPIKMNRLSIRIANHEKGDHNLILRPTIYKSKIKEPEFSNKEYGYPISKGSEDKCLFFVHLSEIK